MNKGKGRWGFAPGMERRQEAARRRQAALKELKRNRDKIEAAIERAKNFNVAEALRKLPT